MDNFRRTFNTTPTVVSRTARVVFSNKQVPNVVTNQSGRAYYAALIKGDTKQCDISETSTDKWEVPYNSSWYWDVDAYCDILLYTNYSDGSQDVTTIDTDVLLRIRYNEQYNRFTLTRDSNDVFYIHAYFEPTSITDLTGYPELNGVQVSYPFLYSPTNSHIQIDRYLRIDPQIFDSQDSMQYVFELDKTDPDNPKLYISKIYADDLTYNYKPDI